MYCAIVFNIFHLIIGLFFYIIYIKNVVAIENVELRKPYLKEIYHLNLRVKELEEKLETLTARVPKRYPEVKFLNYLKRKRILVRVFQTNIIALGIWNN